jgi:hypothetical protein
MENPITARPPAPLSSTRPPFRALEFLSKALGFDEGVVITDKVWV